MTGRQRTIALAVALDVVAVAGAIGLLVGGASPLVLLFGAILAAAPWAAVIDDSDRARREDSRRP